MASFRLDRHPIPRSRAIRCDNGWLRAPATLTRVGVFPYRLPDGSVRRELRTPEEVFSADSLASFELVPLTYQHPGELNAKNSKVHAVGAVGHLVADATKTHVEAQLLVTDEDAVRAIDGGVHELSCGYFAELVHEPGIWIDSNGVAHEYDARQTQIRGNHVAIVQRGRAGPTARIHLDAADAATLHTGDEPMPKIKIDGVEHEVTAEVFAAISAERAIAAEALKAVRADTEKATAKADALEAELAKAKDPTALQEAIKARVSLVQDAAKVLGDADMSRMTDREIREAVVRKLDKDAKLDGRSDDYVQARFDAALSFGGRNRTAEEAEAARKKAGATTPTQDNADPAERDRKLREAIANRYAAQA